MDEIQNLVRKLSKDKILFITDVKIVYYVDKRY